MITLTARIDLISGDSDTLSIEPKDLSHNNISSEIEDILGSKSQGSNPFLLGVSKLGDGSTFSDKVDYFIGNIPSNENGEFQTPYEIEVKGNTKLLNINFDIVNNRYPTSIEVDGKPYTSDDAYYVISGLDDSETSHTITIEDWNTPNYPLVIMGIFVEIEIIINNRNLISLNRNITYRGDNKFPSYGIISNTGNLEFNDLTGEIREYAEQMLLTSDLKVEIKLNNTLANSSEPIGIFETRDWDYDNNNRSVSVSLKDDLEEWQDIQVQGFDYDPRKPFDVLENGTMAELYVWIWNETPEKYSMLDFDSLDATTQGILSSTKIQYPLLKSGSLWEQWQKLCQVCGLYIYKDNLGNTVCRYTYGS